jgi:hypothetical protein
MVVMIIGPLIISEGSISRFTASISILLASVLLFGAIVFINIIKNEAALLGVLRSWTVLFATGIELGFLTNVERD